MILYYFAGVFLPTKKMGHCFKFVFFEREIIVCSLHNKAWCFKAIRAGLYFGIPKACGFVGTEGTLNGLIKKCTENKEQCNFVAKIIII